MATKDYRKLREKLGENQAAFWGRVGVTQSAGSRYESGRKIPGPMQTVLDIAYGTEAEANRAVAKLRGKK